LQIQLPHKLLQHYKKTTITALAYKLKIALKTMHTKISLWKVSSQPSEPNLTSLRSLQYSVHI